MFAQSYDWFVENRAITDDAHASHHRRSSKQGVLKLAKRVSGLLPAGTVNVTLIDRLRRHQTAISVAILARARLRAVR